MKRICKNCGNEFEVPIVGGRYSKRMYCDNCGNWGSSTKTLICKNCGNEFIVERSKTDNRFLIREYCTEECRKEYYNKTHPKEKRYMICNICGNKFEIETTESGQYSQKHTCNVCLKKNKKKKHVKIVEKNFTLSF